jgi:hypothetical protein
MGELGSYFDVSQASAHVDCDQGSDVSNREAVAGNELMPVQFAIHPFETLTSHRSLRFAEFRELLETSLKDRTGILKSASDRSQQFNFHPSVPPLDLGLFTEVAPKKVRFRMPSLPLAPGVAEAIATFVAAAPSGR